MKMESQIVSTCRIVLIEDDRVDSFIFKRNLEKIDKTCEVIAFEYPTEAVQYLESVSSTNGPFPDLIIFDLNMPAMNGHQVINRIKSDPCLAAIPCAVVSSSSAPADISKVKEVGANVYIGKPMSFEKAQQILSLIKK
jgi:CheY-like chemotaxis protein